MADNKKRVVITLTLEDGGGERRIEIDPTNLPLIYLEALDDLKESKTEGWRKLRRGMRKMLHLTEAEAEELEMDHLTAITEAIRQAQDIPNG